MIVGLAIIALVNCTRPRPDPKENSLYEFEEIPTKDGTRKFSTILSRSHFDIINNLK